MPASTKRISRTALRQRLAGLARAAEVAFAVALSAVAIANPLLHRRAASTVTHRQLSAQWSVRAIYFRSPTGQATTRERLRRARVPTRTGPAVGVRRSSRHRAAAQAARRAGR